MAQKPLRHRHALQFNKEQEKLNTNIALNQKYYLHALIFQNDDYNVYRGVDAEKAKWVTLYARRLEHTFQFSTRVKEHLRASLCPKILWAGDLSLSKTNYHFQVHEKLGPSLATVFEYKKQAPSEKELLHLLLELLKVVEKMNNVSLVCGQLTPDLIVFDSSPQKNDLYLLNCFKLKKKREIIRPICSKYSSRGAHLGRSITTKDDLESVCYILFDLYSGGMFLSGKKASELQEAKLSLKIQQFVRGLPPILVDFYHYVTSLNYSDEINFFYWKNTLMRLLTSEITSKPFGFLMKKEQLGSDKSSTSTLEEEGEAMELEVESADLDQYEEDENVVRVGRIMKHSLKY